MIYIPVHAMTQKYNYKKYKKKYQKGFCPLDTEYMKQP